MSEQEIINSLKSRDEQCFISVVDTYKKKVISLCYSYVNDYQEAEDISQEVFISLYKSIQTFRGDSSLSTYIYKITVSKCIDYKRKRSIKNFLTGLLSNTSNENFDDRDDKNYIRQCIEGLPKDIKLPIILYYYVGLNQNEIGEVLNISQKAVEGRIYRAKQRLKIELKKEGTLLCSKREMI